VYSIYTVSPKKQDIKLLPITSPNINRFSNFFHDGLGSKFAANTCINIPPPLTHVAILPCEIWMRHDGVNSLPKTVTRHRRGCALSPGLSAPESSKLATRLPSHPACILCTEIVTDCCYVNWQISVLAWAYYQQISNYCTPVLTYWPTDWGHQCLTEADHVRHFAAASFLSCGSCVQLVMGH